MNKTQLLCLVVVLTLLAASALATLEVSESTIGDFEKWKNDFQDSEPKGELKILSETEKHITAIMPGMSPRTQLMDPALRSALVAKIKDKKYALTSNKQIERRWIMAEMLLVKIPNDFDVRAKATRFYKSISDLGLQEAVYVAAINALGKVKLADRREAFEFFFESDELRIKRLESRGEGKGALSEELFEALKTDDRFQKINKTVSDDAILQEFATWMVKEVYRPIVSEENGKEKIKFLAEEVSQSKDSFPSPLQKKITEKFGKNINLTVRELSQILLYLLEQS